ncbi:hypothetical protein [Brevundimonas sp.]|uniref:hypothetical protein n=1 Tax=Brevundimonas sp. TaxID=1871086 RepID=UPI002899B1EA|nr:hypothetical protein [Brevundimonas sp.]
MCNYPSMYNLMQSLVAGPKSLSDLTGIPYNVCNDIMLGVKLPTYGESFKIAEKLKINPYIIFTVGQLDTNDYISADEAKSTFHILGYDYAPSYNNEEGDKITRIFCF